MARQNGIIKLEGTIGDISFYKSQDGMMARAKGGIDGKRMKTDAAFARTRENWMEFGRAGRAGKLLRMALMAYVKNMGDKRMVSRLTKEMMVVVKADATSARGQRNVLDGELELLTGFNFNAGAPLSTVLKTVYTATIDRATGLLSVAVPGFVPAHYIDAPEAASHVRLVTVGAAINFEAGTYETVTAQSAEIALGNTVVAAIALNNQLAANSTHPLFLVLGIEFMQTVNGSPYPLRDKSFNALAIVAVSGV